jgi:hypothetical protein
MGEKVVIDSDAMDRLPLMRMDLEPHEAQTISDLRHEVIALRHALRLLVEAVNQAELVLSPGEVIDVPRAIAYE